MPTYSYACTTCGHRFDVQQSFSDAALTACPECDGRLRKLFGDVGVVFKGSGFYRTDARAERSSSSGRRTGGSSGSRVSEPAAATAGASSGSSGSTASNGSSATAASSTAGSPTSPSSSSSSSTTAPRAAAD